MRVLLRLFFSFLFIVALVAIVLSRDELARTAPLLPEAAIILLAAGFGFSIAIWPGHSTSSGDAVIPLATPSPDASATTDGDSVDDRALLVFARRLLAATAGADVQATVEAELPALLNGRKVWLAFEQQARHETAPAAPSRMKHLPVLTDDVQEWTTFPLRLEEQRIGLLGVESAGGLAPLLKQRLKSVTPLISQALRTAQEVDVFREASIVDLLTGAATRREGLNRLHAEVKRAQRTGSTMAVLMIDLDHFKSINDQFGHAIGDALLTAIGQTMVRTLRASDIRCRWGGEEFLIVLPDTTLGQAQVVATHLLQNLAATSVPSAKGPVSSTASLGLTVSRPAETDINRIVARADTALYQAKNAGRSCVRVVLGGFDGEPVGTEGPRKGPASTAERLPFPDRRSPHRHDRRGVPSPGRRRTDASADARAGNPNEPFVNSERKFAKA